ncbi:hypothetical protein BCR44DRAFT_32918 [Catenaria anguillulae PL171]|uniref:Uncharacterized protein n=1 Tax=Catenaria anguillulae PL171 TaxID=765915 RepID=A0A1Y2HG31_9FUNG|nr:hypothetical protein BCR44DRAFT_32918 [Catenaria anguillulae PL171]
MTMLINVATREPGTCIPKYFETTLHHETTPESSPDPDPARSSLTLFDHVGGFALPPGRHPHRVPRRPRTIENYPSRQVRRRRHVIAAVVLCAWAPVARMTDRHGLRLQIVFVDVVSLIMAIAHLNFGLLIMD